MTTIHHDRSPLAAASGSRPNQEPHPTTRSRSEAHLTITAEPDRTADAALRRHGITWQQLEKLAHRALNDHLRKRRITLDADRYTEAHEHLVDVGARWALEYDPGKARGVSFTSSCYRRMYPRVTDYLRGRHGDERRGTPLHQIPAGDTLPDRRALDEETFEQLVEHVSHGLTTRALNTLHTVGYDLLVLGLARWEIAQKRVIPIEDIENLLEEIGWQLGATLKAAA
jgi:hypothetical protein